MNLVQIKVGGQMIYGLSDGKWVYPYELTKAEKKLEAKTGWPRKLPDTYQGPKWPEER